jgi:ribose 5-phosphate isomerase A
MTNADRALDFVADGMTVGLGSGRAAERFIRALADRAKKGLHIRGVPTSNGSADLAKQLGLTLVTLDDVSHLDVTVDGADEVDPNLNLIKGYGRAHVREKVVAFASRRLVILVGPDGVEEKLVPVLGTRGKLPIEVLAFALPVVRGKLEELGIAATPLTAPDGTPVRSDNGNPILTGQVGPLTDPAGLDRQLTAIPGVVGTGLFIGMADTVIVEHKSGEVEVRQRPSVTS